MANESRYERVRRILDEAAGGPCADYGGYQDFWNLPYEEFLTVEIFGIRMIAPLSSGTGASTASSSYTARVATPARAGSGGGSGGCCGGGGKGGGNGNGNGNGGGSAGATSDPAKAAASGGSGGSGGSESGDLPDCDLPDCVVREPGRGARSGLIRGLKGQPPFDGSRYPQLMWGGETVSSADVSFISLWIDDGCPPTDDTPACKDPQPGKADWRTACGMESTSMTMNDYQDAMGKTRVRKNYESLTAEELCKLRFAVGQLRDLDQYPADNRSFSYWARVHGDHCEHGWEEFLPWHRAYLYRFEMALQKVVPGVTLPYWKWTMPMYYGGAVPPQDDRPYPPQSGRVPTALRCFVSDQTLKALRDGSDGSGSSNPVPPDVLKALEGILNDKAGSDRARLYNSSWELFVAAGLDADTYASWGTAVAAQLVKTNPLWHDFRYPGMFYETQGNQQQPVFENGFPVLANQGLRQFHHHYPSADEVQQILALNNWHDFGGGHVESQSFGVLSQNPHNTGHIWSGGANPFWLYPNTDPAAQPSNGDMFNDLTAFFDPIGYAHHSYIDYLWWQWQQQNPAGKPDDLTSVMIPFQLTVDQLLDIRKLGYEYVQDAKMHATDSGAEMMDMSTDMMSFGEHVMDDMGRAEVRFHNVRRAVNSYNVRVFLNQPGADASTPMAGNPHYVGYFGRFGHGPCVGGPGHCDDPAPPSRFEIPIRPHNTPQNYRLDATEAVRALREEGETEFQVNFVVVGGNGKAPEGLKMDGVSLHVMD